MANASPDAGSGALLLVEDLRLRHTYCRVADKEFRVWVWGQAYLKSNFGA